MIEAEVILPRRVVPQPTPNINPQGDCGPCAFSGLVGLPSPQAVYDRWFDGKPKAFTEMDIRRLLHSANDLIDRYICDHPIWPQGYTETWGLPSWNQCLEWFGYIQMAMDAGYYALCQVNYAREGPFKPTDHWILLVGARFRWVPNERVEGASTGHSEVLVSCSARSSPDEEWVDVRDFLQHRGGFDAYLARPRAA